jgi:hypothetical protein
MGNPSREEHLRLHATVAFQKMHHAGETLALRQSNSGPHRGNVPPWPGCEDLDFHGTLAAMWIWARVQSSGDGEGPSGAPAASAFTAHLAAGWRFVRSAWARFIPASLASGATDEAPYDCAMVLRAAVADPVGVNKAEVKGLADMAARLLGAYLTDLDDMGGRAFADPGFLVASLAEYARQEGDRGLLASARGFIDRRFGMKALPSFAGEPAATDDLFDFSSTTAMRVLAVLAGEGTTPFTGAWLRERVAPAIPREFVARPMDENCWNACVAAALGRAYVVATDPTFLRAHQTIMQKLDGRIGAMSGMLGRQPGMEDETMATFYYAFALHSMVVAI